MSDLMKRIEREAKKLTPQERVILADRLMNSLGDNVRLRDVEMQFISETENQFSESPTDPQDEDGMKAQAFPEKGQYFV